MEDPFNVASDYSITSMYTFHIAWKLGVLSRPEILREKQKMTHRRQSAGDRWCDGIIINQLQLVMNLDFAKVIFVFLAWRRQHRARHLRHLNFRIVHHIKTDNKYRLYCWGAKGYWAIIWKIEENVSNAEKQEREASRVFSSLTLQTYQEYIQEAFNVSNGCLWRF